MMRLMQFYISLNFFTSDTIKRRFEEILKTPKSQHFGVESGHQVAHSSPQQVEEIVPDNQPLNLTVDVNNKVLSSIVQHYLKLL
jgi:hypothetical protein